MKSVFTPCVHMQRGEAFCFVHLSVSVHNYCMHCKNKVVILAKYLVTTVAWLLLLHNAELEKDSCSGS